MMRLKSISIQHFRSINKTGKLTLSPLTILVGPNNEGKSNILRAIVVAMEVLRQFSAPVGAHRAASRIRLRREHYDWTRDYPIDLQDSKPDGTSTFDLVFELTDDEIAQFWDDVGSRIKNPLPIRLSIGPETASFSVRKKGRGSTTLAEKRARIARFIGSRLRVEYIGSIRTASAAMRVVDSMVAAELATVEESEEYTAALETISRLQTPILEGVAETIASTLREFLPDVRTAKVAISETARTLAMRRDAEVIVDDGSATPLELKGDGVQSLAALALIRHFSERRAAKRELVLAVEEPEAHLHPEAIHRLKRVIQEIADPQQVILTTHSPLLVSRRRPQDNIIVESNKARSAQSMAELRDVLGVRASDNLHSAELVLVVEGSTDAEALRAVLADESAALADALESGRLAIDSLGGGGNLGYKLSLLDALMCQYHVFLDADEAGRSAIRRARDAALLDDAAYCLAAARGMRESEWEDLLDPTLYSAVLLERFGVTMDQEFNARRSRWSNRMCDLFRRCGKDWNEETESTVKRLISERVQDEPGLAVAAHDRGPIDTLVTALHGLP